MSALISRSTSRTAAICSSASSLAPSTTCTRRSANCTDLSVLMKASISPCGRLEIKPTVSVTNTVSPPGSASWRVRGSKVTNSRSWASTPALVRALSIDDLPALV